MKLYNRILLRKTAGSLIVLFVCFQSARGQDRADNGNEVQLDRSNVVPVYTNYARVTASADEVVIDLGMFAAPEGKMPPIKVHHQAVMNYYTLKRLAANLQATLEQHERLFGPIELDVNKRVKQ